jgi:multiple sugar transport system substrate-binding protein
VIAMPNCRRVWLSLAVALLCGLALFLLVGCDISPSQPTAGPALPTGTLSPTEPTAAPTDTAPMAPSVITLTVWTTEAFSPTQVITSGRVLAQAVTDFQASQPDVRLDFVLKKPYGKGGILDFLSTTYAAVPDLLPDMVILDVDELSTAVQAGLVQPVDDLLPADLVADLYPLARDTSTFSGRLYGLQFQADLDHLVYSSGRMALPPSSWPGVLSNPGPYIFPAGGRAGLVNDAFLIQYLAVKPWSFQDNPDDPFLEADALAAVLQYYQDGVSRGIVPLDVLDYHTTADSWREYLADQAAMTQVSAHEYLSERSRSPSSAAAPIPAINGPAAGINRGWVLALVTTEPVRQSVAAAFMTQLMIPETNAAWNRAAGYLPTRQAALVHWDAGDSYTPFIHQQLQMAQPRPAIPNYARIGAALQQAVEDVLTGVATPEEAAAKALESAN